MHIPARTFVTACALSAALLVAGCGGDNQKDKSADGSGGEVFLQPVAARGPDPFTESTATATPPPVTRTPQSRSTGSALAPQGMRSVSGSTPGLYGGTQNVGSCDVEKQIGFLAADQSKARAFARASGISRASIPGFLRGLTSVALRADTRVTDHGFRGGQATSFQSVLQVGTAVLVDNRGLPRVRCACSNPLNPPETPKGNPGTQGRPWSGYRPAEVIAVTPAPTVITSITIINLVNNTWIERRIGDDGDHDRVVPPPDDWTRTRSPDDSSSSAIPRDESSSRDEGERSSPEEGESSGPEESESSGLDEDERSAPDDDRSSGPDDDRSSAPDEDRSSAPDESASDCVTPTATVTVTPGATESAPGETARSDSTRSDSTRSDSAPSDAPTDESSASVEEPSDCPTATVTAPPTTPSESTTPSDESTAPETDPTDPTDPADPTTPDQRASEVPESPLDESSAASEEIGPDTVPESPDVPDGGGLIPDESSTSDSIFDTPTDVFDS